MFKKRIKEERLKRKLNQTQMANRLELSQRIISNLEIGRNEPDIKTIIKYCKYFNVSADYILGLIDYPRPLK